MFFDKDLNLICTKINPNPLTFYRHIRSEYYRSIHSASVFALYPCPIQFPNIFFYLQKKDGTGYFYQKPDFKEQESKGKKNRGKGNK